MTVPEELLLPRMDLTEWLRIGTSEHSLQSLPIRYPDELITVGGALVRQKNVSCHEMPRHLLPSSLRARYQK